MTEAIDALVVTAMDEEAHPFLVNARAVPVDVAIGAAWRLTIRGRSVVVLRSGIGLVNSACATASALARFQPRALLSSGSAGGLAEGIHVGDVVVGVTYAYADADASAFGYAPGQIPSMPPDYSGDATLVSLAASARRGDQRVRPGKVVSGNSFVDARTVAWVRATFPGALAADMESTALAQLAFLVGLPFISVRGISDLCGPHAGDDFTYSVEEVSGRAAAVVQHVIERMG